MTDAHGVARDQLRAFIERIERLEEEKKTIADDIKDIYGEAKGMGYDAKILRKVIAIRKQDRDERETDREAAAERVRAAANAGGDDVDGGAERATHLVTGEGAANTALPAKPKVSFRPNCQHPENCASGTRDHCWSCRRAMQKSEEMA